MKKQVTVSAPGKLLLMGDHAVVYDRPCLVAAIDKRIYVTIKVSAEPGLLIDAPDINLVKYHKDFSKLTKGEVPKQAEYIEQVVHEFRKQYDVGIGIEVSTSAPELDSRFGFGTSAATLAATVFALNELTHSSLERKQLFDIAYKSVHALKGVGSGFDVAASLFGSVLYFETGGKEIRSIELNQDLDLTIAYSGHKADTPTIVKRVAMERQTHVALTDRIFDDIKDTVTGSIQLLEQGNFEAFGSNMNKQQKFLEELGVSTKELDEICNLANASGAYGAKLSGAGGGDIALILSPEGSREHVISRLRGAGYVTMELQVDHEGARIEKSE
jgi:mevalonate kinase